MFPQVWDQGNLGACTSFGLGAAVAYLLTKQGLKMFRPSNLFIYWNERNIEGTVNQDSGAMIRDGVKVLNKLGAPNQFYWPYDISKFTQKPPQVAFQNALKTIVTEYLSVDNTNLAAIQAPLAQKLPVVIGISVYESFESDQVAKTGIVPMPKKNEKLLGGHCVVLTGYNNSTQRFNGRNSWSEQWGDKGNFTIPYNYILNPNLCDDAWVLEMET